MKLTATKIQETEKAYKVSLTYQHLQSLKQHQWMCWMPKSQVKFISDNSVEAPVWLADKIGNEIRERVPGMCRNMGGDGVTYNF